VDEEIVSSTVGRDKAEALCGVEPLDSSAVSDPLSFDFFASNWAGDQIYQLNEKDEPQRWLRGSTMLAVLLGFYDKLRRMCWNERWRPALSVRTAETGKKNMVL
jgi:hypothetical protein